MARRTLLCVEPDGAALEVIRGTLGPVGFDVTNIANGEQAVDWARKNGPALIVVSVEPRKVGYAVCNKIKRSNELKATPVILTSSEETQETFEQHKKLKSRANEYLLKPLGADELLEKVKTLVGIEPQQGPGPDDIFSGTEDLEEIPIAEDDIVEMGSVGGPTADEPEEIPAEATRATPGGFVRSGELDAIFDQETDAALAKLQGSEADQTGPISADPAVEPTGAGDDGPAPWASDAAGFSEEAEATRAAPAPESALEESVLGHINKRGNGSGAFPAFASPDTPPSPDEVSLPDVSNTPPPVLISPVPSG